MDQSTKLRLAVFFYIAATFAIVIRTGLFDLDDLTYAQRLWTGLPIYTLVAVGTGYVIDYFRQRHTDRKWAERAELQRAKAYYAIMYPERVFKVDELTTLLDLDTQEVLATNDPLIRDSDPEFFQKYPERFVNYPLGVVDN